MNSNNGFYCLCEKIYDNRTNILIQTCKAVILSIWTICAVLGLKTFFANFIYGDLYGVNLWLCNALVPVVILIIVVGVPSVIFRSTKIFSFKLLGLFPTRNPWWLMIIVSIILGVVVYFFIFCPVSAYIVDHKIGLFFGSIFPSNNLQTASFISLVICAPICEEIIFRGWFYGNLRRILCEIAPKSRINTIVAVIVSILVVSIVFGFSHDEPEVALNAAWISVVSCVMRECTTTIYGGLTLHLWNNWNIFLKSYMIMLA